ncbi:hypothetical protein HWI79_125 [Cryptosporidium felis]|nr:hypothetical protein HWI79_125 [Cryptosporidium felis]
MHDSEDYFEYSDFFNDNSVDSLSESSDEKSEIEYCSPRFGQVNYLDEEIDDTTEKEIIIDDQLKLHSDTETPNEEYYSGNNEEISLKDSNSDESRYSHDQDTSFVLRDSETNENKAKEEPSNFESSDLQDIEEKDGSREDVKLKNADVKVNIKLEENISYKELQRQVKYLLEASNKHQEEVHAELDSLLLENEKYILEIDRLNSIIKEKELLLSQYKLNSLALNAQIPFLKSKSFMDEEKEELSILRNKVKILECKINESEKELEEINKYKERASFLENELERATNEFSELELFQTEQLRIADNEIISLTEAKNILFKEMHSVMKDNESLKLTRSVIKRIESYFRNIKDEKILPNIEEELKDAINTFVETNEINENNESSIAFEICQFIIPRLAYEIAEEIVVKCDGDGHNNKPNRSLSKKNVSVQVGFPLLNGSNLEGSEIGLISSRNELISLRSENNKLRKENQKLKQDIFLMKRINNRIKDHPKVNLGLVNTKPSDSAVEPQREELVLNGIKWLTTVVNEIDDLEQRYSNIKNCHKTDTRLSSAYNSTVASLEDIDTELQDQTSKSELNVDTELNQLREKLVNEGILI